LRRTLRGYLGHANVAAALLISLGCEVNQPENFSATWQPRRLSIQELGGTAATVNAALGHNLEPGVADHGRAPHTDPLAELTLGLQCGGSDAYSGLTANPTLGVAADLLVAAGGKVVLGETPEIYGAHHLLRDRASTPEAATRIDELISWWQEYTTATARHSTTIRRTPFSGWSRLEHAPRDFSNGRDPAAPGFPGRIVVECRAVGGRVLLPPGDEFVDACRPPSGSTPCHAAGGGRRRSPVSRRERPSRRLRRAGRRPRPSVGLAVSPE